MKPILNRLLCGIVGSALGATAATAQTVNHGDLLLGVQAGGNPGQTTNVFVNLGPGHVLRDAPSPGVIKNINAELTAAFGANWFTRTDVYFGIIANRNASFSGPTENGDPTQTFYLSRAAATPAGAAAHSGYGSTALRSAGTFLAPQVAAVNAVTANSNGVRTMSQAANAVEWDNSWTRWNPIGFGAYDIFTGGIQNNLGKTGQALVDLQRLLPSAAGTYVTTIALTSTGNIVASQASSYVTLNLTIGANGTVTSTEGAVAGDNSFPSGQVVNLTAVPSSGFIFDQWTGDFAPATATSPSIAVTMSAAKSLTATFKVDPKSLALTVGANGTVAVRDGNGDLIDPAADEDVNSPTTHDVVTGSTISLTATPDTGFEFLRFIQDGVNKFTNPLSITMDSDVAVSAQFVSTANTSGPSNGFSDAELAALQAIVSNLRVGDTVRLFLPLTLDAGTFLVLNGLPAGLSYNAATREIEGTVLAELGSGAVSAQITRNTVVRQAYKVRVGGKLVTRYRNVTVRVAVESVALRMTVEPYLYAGAYQAIIEDGNDVPVGRVGLTLTTPTTKTAFLQLVNEGGITRSLSGAAIALGTISGGEVPVTLTFPAIPRTTTNLRIYPTLPISGLAATTVTMNLPDPAVSDLVDGANGTNALRGFRLVKPGRAASQPVTVALENGTPGDRVLTPAGSGFGTGSLSGIGAMTMTGFLGDGQSYTASLNLSETNQMVVWIQPYVDKTQSFVGGILDAGNLVIAGRGGDSPSAPLDNGLSWAKAPRAAELSYPGGFGVAGLTNGAPIEPLAVDAFLSKWYPVTSVDGMSLSLGLTARNLEVSYTEPPVAPQLPAGSDLPDQLNLRGAFALVRMTPGNSVSWSGTAVPVSGLFSGTLGLTLPAAVTGRTRAVPEARGVFLQEEQLGDPTKVGVGFVRIPTNGTGSFETSGIRLDNN